MYDGSRLDDGDGNLGADEYCCAVGYACDGARPSGERWGCLAERAG